MSQTVIPHDVAALALYDDEAKLLRVHTLNSPVTENLYADEGFVMALEDSPAGKAATTRRPVLINKLDRSEYASPIVARAYAAGIRSSCNVPLVSHDRLLELLLLRVGLKVLSLRHTCSSSARLRVNCRSQSKTRFHFASLQR